MNTYPLTESQLGMFLEWNADRSSTQYALAFSLDLSPDLDADRLERAFRETLDAHPVYRTRLVEENGVVRQFSDASLVIPFSHHTLAQGEADAYAQASIRPFDVFAGPLVRLDLVEAPECRRLLIQISHLITDGASLLATLDEVAARYSGETPPPEDLSFADYARAEPESFGSDAYRAAADEARKRFAGHAMTVPDAPAEAPSTLPCIASHAEVDRAAIDAFCAKAGIGANLFFAGVFARVLALYANARDVMFFTVNHGRKDPRLKRTQGFLVKSLPLLGELRGEASLADYFRSFKVHHAGAYPFSHFCRDLGVGAGWGFVFQNNLPYRTIAFGSASATFRCIGNVGAGTLPVFEAIQQERTYRLDLTVTPTKYGPKFLSEFVTRCATFARQAATADIAAPLASVPLLDEAEAERVLAVSRGDEIATDVAKTFVDLAKANAFARPSATAVVDCEDAITYGELDARSNALARELVSRGVTPRGFVALMLPRRVAFPVACLAVQKCGAGYVPLDADYPAERLAYMLENSESRVLVTTHALCDGKNLDFKGEIVYLDAFAFGEAEPINLATPETPAYMIYTSGSTGRPKGVVVPSRALRHLCAWTAQAFGLGPASHVMAHPSFSFDASVADIFPALAAGGELHILGEDLRKDLPGIRDYVVAHAITGGTMSTQIGMTLLDAYPDIPLSYLFLGGEKLLPIAKTKVKIVNGYGPTEFTVASSFHVVDQAAEGDIPIGRAVPGTWSLVVDPLGQAVPLGMAGEIALAGPQIADGYWKNPEKTAAAFVACPTLGGRMYRTGDLARYNGEGLLEYLGRIDFQVKLRGFRIEIGEIEHAAAACEGVGAVAAEVRDVAGAPHLVLYYEKKDPSPENLGESLRAKMAESLTSYMVPDYFVCLEAMPLTPNGKIDRRRLPAPQVEAQAVETPANDLERRILACVEAVMKASGIGVTSDLRQQGLTSLGAIALTARLRSECGLAVTLRQLDANPTVRALATLAGAKATSAPKAARPRRATYPMTENQRGIYADWLRHPEALQYNVPAVFRFAKVAPETLAAALEKVLAAHPAFMTRFIEKDGEIVQQRRDDLRLAVEIERLDAEPDVAFFAAQMKPFRPDAEVLARCRVYAAPNAAYAMLDAHHTVFDGCSVGLFLRDLEAALAGRALAGESYTAFDAALDERDYLESEALAEDDAWFARYLDGAESTAVTTSTCGAEGAEGEIGRVRERVAAAKIDAAARARGATASDWLLAAFTELLRRVGRADDVTINFVTAGRSHPETQNTIGMFVKTLPLRGVRNAATFAEAVRSLHASVGDLIERERMSFVRLSERLGLRPDILFAFEGGIFDLPEGVEILDVPLATAKAPLSVVVTPKDAAYEIMFEYDRSKYSAFDMTQLIGLFARLAERFADRAEAPLASVPLLDEAEAERVLAVSRGDEIAYDDAKTFVDLAKANAIARPFATAVVDCEGAITYGELDARSNALARELVSRGVTPRGFVALMLPRRLAFPVACLAVQKCGAGYVPLDADYPAERLAYMLENSESRVLVTTHALCDGKNLDFKGEIVYLDAFAFGEAEPINLATPETPAYMIYTSGSTGRPKGVVVPERALRHLCAWVPKSLGLGPTSRVMTHPSFSFDASVLDIFPALAAGGELHILCEDLRKDLPGLRDYAVSHAITGGVMSTQIGSALLDTYPDLPLSYLVVGGEKLLPIAKTNVKIINGYGPTEFTVESSFHVVDQTKEGEIPIGRAVPGTWSLIVDREGHLLPLGMTGEIALAGPQIADGYWKNPEKTAAAFVACPALGGRMYRTGDLARYNAEGLLEYLGRIDFQVKLRGFRIEIGEIEHAAAACEGVGAVAAEVRDVAGAPHLVLYYERKDPSAGDLGESLRAKMAETLTSYMVPDYFVMLEAMPLTPNGKIDRRRLPAPSGTDGRAKEVFVEPANETERKIAEAYRVLLRLERFGATTDFFASGGTSLLGIKAVVALQKLGLDVQYGDLFKFKTPRELAAFLTGETQGVVYDAAAYDYKAIDALLAATPTDLFGSFRRHSLGDVLLCGATGFLGTHVLRTLLETTDATVYALIRPKRGIVAASRLDAQFVYYFGEKVPRRYRDRIAFVEGDITDEALGDKLAGLRIGTVMNCAALVKHYVADDLMDRINVDGVKNLIAWCAGSGARLVHVSTYSVGGLIRANSGAVLDERHLYIGQTSDNEYVRTKFLAERAVLEAVAAGSLRGKVMRLGNLMSRENDGEFQMNVGANAFVNSLKSYRALGAYPLEDLATPIEMSPIDRVAEAVCLLATTPDEMVVFHPYNAYPLDMGAVVGAMNRRGFEIDCVSRDEFAAAVDRLRHDPARATALQGVLHYAAHLEKDQRVTPAPNYWTTTVLYRLGFRWKPADDAYLTRFLDMLDGLAVFD